MHKIKIFKRFTNELDQLEKDFSDWSSNKKNPEIVNIIQSMSTQPQMGESKSKLFQSFEETGLVVLTVHYKE